MMMVVTIMAVLVDGDDDDGDGGDGEDEDDGDTHYGSSCLLRANSMSGTFLGLLYIVSYQQG